MSRKEDYVDLGITTTEVREHYARVREVYESLATVDVSEGLTEATGADGYPTIASNDDAGWYVKRDNDHLPTLEQGYDRVGWAATFDRDYETLTDRVERCLYAVTSYKDPTSLREVPCRYLPENSETEWHGAKPMPVKADLRGVMAWGDIDLADDLKPERGDLDDETREVVDATIEAYIDEFETLYGSREAVFGLDSVGGLYIMGAPAATVPVAETFHGDDDAIVRLMQAFIDRSNEWLEAAQGRVEERVDGAAGVIDPDWVNNHNRKYKAPLAVHAKHDAVVTPIDTEDPSYDLTTFEDVDGDLVDDAREWAEDLTATEHTSCIKSLVENLWPEYSAEHDDWKAALTQWVEDERRAEERARAAAERARENRPDPADLSLTTDVRDVYNALDRLDTEAVAEATIVHQWTDQASGKTDTSGSGKRAFVPTWGPGSNGTATYVDLEQGTFVDTGSNDHGTAVEMALLAEDDWTKGKIAKGADWSQGVDILRDLGFEIPVWIPEAGSEKKNGGGDYETMPYWAVREAAVALEVVPEDAFVRKQSDNGSYLSFPGSTTYNRTLAALEDEDIDHGREYMTEDGERPPDIVLWGDGEVEQREALDTSGSEKKGSDSGKSWGYVRFLYEEEDSKKGRAAAEDLLRSKYEFMTVEAEKDGLYLYNDEKGIYTKDLGEVRGEIHDGLGEHWTTHELKEITARLQQKPLKKPREFNGRECFEDPHICVKNGVLNLFTRELKKHSPDYNFVDRVPVTYDPDAGTERYEEFLAEITSREEDAKAMMEMVGHALVPDAHDRKWKKFLILYGGSDNGKSFFYDRVTDLLEGTNGEENNVMNVKLAKLASNRFSKKSMYGHMANIAGEVNGKKIRNTADLKDITGGDSMEIEPKGGDSFSDTMNTTLMFAANDPPIIGERDKKAIATRIVPVELPYRFVDDPSEPMEKEKVPAQVLKQELTSEEAMSGFLNLALEGISRFEGNNDVSLPESPMERLRRYESGADPMKEFARTCLTQDTQDYIVKADVTRIYEEFAAENGYETGSSTHSTLHGALEYPDSYPRNPDYSDTSLPLRPWDGRQYVINRVTLTQEGLQYAHTAGLVVDEETTPNSTEETSDLHSPEKGFGTVTVQVAEMLEPPEWLQGKGHIVDGAGNIIPYECKGEQDPLGAAGVEQGDEVRLQNVKFRETSEGMTAVLSAVTDVEVTTRPDGQAGLESKQAAADGGEEDANEEPGESPTQGASVRTRAREAADAVPCEWVSRMSARTKVTEQLDVGMPEAAELLDAAGEKHGYIEVDDSGSTVYVRRID